MMHKEALQINNTCSQSHRQSEITEEQISEHEVFESVMINPYSREVDEL